MSPLFGGITNDVDPVPAPGVAYAPDNPTKNVACTGDTSSVPPSTGTEDGANPSPIHP